MLPRIAPFASCYLFVTCCCLWPMGTVLADDPLPARFQALHETPNWRFITPEFVEEIEARQASMQGKSVSVATYLSDEDRQPIQDAFGLIRLKSNSTLNRKNSDVIAVGWSDQAGILRVHADKTPWTEPAYPVNWELLIFAPGKAVAQRKFTYLEGTRVEPIQLVEGREVKLTVLDAEGKPLPGVTMVHDQIVNPYQTGAIELSFLWSQCLCPVTSDASGILRFGGLPEERIVSFSAINAKYEDFGVPNIATSELDAAKLIPKDGPLSMLVYPFEVSARELRAPAGFQPSEHASRLSQHRETADQNLNRIEVVVKDAFTGEGVPQVPVRFVAQVRKAESLRLSPGCVVTDDNGVATLETDRSSGFVMAMGRCWGYKTHYQRITNSLNEYRPQLKTEEWLKPIEIENGVGRVEFELQPVLPLEIQVLDHDGLPLSASIHIERHGWNYTLPAVKTDAQGKLTIPIRPVFVHIDIEATTADGRFQRVEDIQLSRNLSVADPPIEIRMPRPAPN